MKFVLAGVRVILILANTGFQITLLLIDSAINGKTIHRGFKHRRRWAKWTMRICGIKVDELQGNVDIEPALIISNHRSLLDPLIQLAYINAFVIAKSEVSSLPIISQGAKMTGIIFVDRGKLKSRLAAREMTKSVLSGGHNVLVYAEGTTGTDRTTIKFKPGTFGVATELKVPVISVALEYAEEKDYWYDGSLGSQVIRQIGVWRTRIKMRISDPIHDTNSANLLNTSRKMIDENLIGMQQDWSAVFKHPPGENGQLNKPEVKQELNSTGSVD